MQWFMFYVTLLVIIGTITGGITYSQQMRRTTFENTIESLSDEQKCIHICGFEFRSYFDKYKFCLEKCDRISERAYNYEVTR